MNFVPVAARMWQVRFMLPRHLAIRVTEHLRAIPAGRSFGKSCLLRMSSGRIPWALLPVICGSALLPCVSAHGTYHDLIERIDVELANNPEDGEILFRRARIHLGHQEWMLAMLDLQKVETLSPGRFPTRWFKGQALDQGGKFVRARTELDAFILAHPGHGGALASRGRVLRKLGDHRAAVADFRAALVNSSEIDPDLVIEIAGAMVDAGAVEEAADLLDSSLQQYGQNTPVLLKALEIELKAKRWDAALRRVDSLQITAPRPELWMAKRAEILALAGRADESHAAWRNLAAHLRALPNLERGTRDMQAISRQALDAIHPPDNSAHSPIPITTP